MAAEWAWAWPANRRMLYNRASADPDGKPWSERKKYLWWDEAAGRWAGPDVPDFPLDKRPDYRPARRGRGGRTPSPATDPFIMQGDGKGWLFAPTGLVDGPLPTHYEPHESPIANPLYGQQSNPARKQIRRRGNRPNPTAGRPGADVFPYVVTTYRLTEHHTAGGMSRFLAYLAELQPAPICEVGPELAAERGLVNGDWATVVTARSAIEARVLVTDRMPALAGSAAAPSTRSASPTTGGRRAWSTGDSANDLLGLALDPNVVHPGVEGGDVRRPARPAAPGPGACRHAGGRLPAGRAGLEARRAEWPDQPRMGFFTDTSICIGCKACEVACKEWNGVPGQDGVRASWASPTTTPASWAPTRGATWPSSSRSRPDERTAGGFRWLMSSDVCKHCTSAACLEVCPTGSLVRTEFGTVVVQEDICNGCGYCIPACPFGVIDQREADGRVWKCTMCYDRLRGGLEPACATACPTKSIQFGPLDELRARAAGRVDTLQAAGVDRGPPVRRRPGRRRRRHGRLLPPPRRPRGLPPPPRPGRHHPRPPRDVASAAPPPPWPWRDFLGRRRVDRRDARASSLGRR